MIHRMSALILLGILTMTTAAWGIEIVAHRGASHDAPENTLAAFELAWQQDAGAIESDFHLTKDGRIVAIHDKTTNRTTGKDWAVAEHTLAELRTLDAGRWKGERWTGQRIPTLDETLAALPPGKRIFIEIKCGVEIVPVLKDRLKQADLESGQAVVMSFNDQVVAAVKEQMPQMPTYWLFAFDRDEQTGQWNMTPERLIENAKRIGADGVALRANEAVNKALADKLAEAGLELRVWTVDDPALARRMAELDVESIITNRPALIGEGLEDRTVTEGSGADEGGA